MPEANYLDSMRVFRDVTQQAFFAVFCAQALKYIIELHFREFFVVPLVCLARRVKSSQERRVSDLEQLSLLVDLVRLN